MTNELVIKKCDICGGMIRVLKDSNFICCGEKMKSLIPNSVECSVEKHLPTYERVEDEIYVKVPHVMEKEHYIEWIALVSENKVCMVELYPEQNAETRFKYISGSELYAYCNKHGLWKIDVK